MTTTKSITESGMEFSVLAENFFYIEKSQTYAKIKKDGVKMAEFLLLSSGDQPTIWIIEAKSSSPRPERENFGKFVEEISEKFTNAFTLFIAIYLKRHNTFHELSENLQNLTLEKVNFRFILVIKGHKKDWFPPLQDALQTALRPLVKTWNLSSVIVLNDTMAREYGLIR